MTQRQTKFATISVTREDRDEMRRLVRALSVELDRDISLSQLLRHAVKLARWHREELITALEEENSGGTGHERAA